MAVMAIIYTNTVLEPILVWVIGVSLFAVFSVIIYLRGYLLLGTPSFETKYLPDAIQTNRASLNVDVTGFGRSGHRCDVDGSRDR